MLNLKEILKNKEEYIKKLKTRDFDLSILIKKLEELNESVKSIDSNLIPLLEKKNKISKEVGNYKKEKKEALATASLKEANKIAEALNKFDDTKENLKREIEKIMFSIPNVPRGTCPVGKSENDNEIISTHLDKNKITNKRPHYEIAIEKKMIDFDRGRKVSGSRYNYVIGQGAQLYQALINFMIEKQTKNGFSQMFTPLIVNTEAMIGTGQLPKFENDQYKIEGENKWLIPTGEVSLTNYYANEIVPNDNLNTSIFALTNCFRKEAGSAGRDNKGIIRMHQFLKLELVKIIKPEDDLKEFKHLLDSAKSILDDLKLPYQIVELCTGDIGNSANKTFDLEVWMPSEEKYREISSVSSFGDYQARRMKTRYKNPKTNKNEFVFTQNASGLAVDRTFAAIIENYTNPKGELEIPQVLKKYLPFTKI